jgi:putative membrane protein
MKRMIQFSAALAMAVALTACAGDDAREMNETPATGTGGAVTGTTGTFDGDRDFVEEHLEMGNAEVELGRIAQERATHPDVKAFAQELVRDHQAAGEELRRIATTANPNFPATIDDEAREELTELREEMAKLTGRDFDRRYIDEMIDDHQEAVDDLEDKAENASHSEVRAWAAKTLPTVRQHLERARALKESLENAGDNR